MCPKMYMQVTLGLKLLVAYITLKCFLSYVREHVLLEVTTDSELLVTQFTLERPFPCVGALM